MRVDINFVLQRELGCLEINLLFGLSYLWRNLG